MDDDADDDARARDRTRDALLVSRLRAGDERAFGEIYDVWYDRVHDLARRIVRDEGRAAEVAQDTFLSAWRRIDSLADPASLGGWLLRIARNRALNVVEKEGRSVAVDDESMHRIEAGGPNVSAPDGFRVAELAGRGDPAEVVEHDEVAALLWEAADALGERDRTVLDLQLRHGLTPAEIGEVVGVNRNAANQLVHRVKGRLEHAVQARVLWRGTRPSCEALQAALAAAGVDTFDSRAVTITNNHAETCEECGERRHLRLQPAALFGALPIVMAPFALKQQAAAALAADGVPMHGSSALAHPVGRVGDSNDPSTGGSSDGPGGADATAAGVTAAATHRDGEPRTGGRRTAVAVAVVLALFVLAAGIGLAVGGDDADGDEEVRSGTSFDTGDEELAAAPTTDAAESTTTSTDDETTTTGPSTTTTSSSTTTPTSPANGQPSGSDPPLVVSPAGPTTSLPPSTATPPPAPTTTTSPGPAASASITVSPSSYSGATPYTSITPGIPRLQWSSSGGSFVTVTGPGFSSTAADSSGSVVCPGLSDPWSTCLPPAGLHRYQIRVFDAGGNVIVSRSAYLTIT